MMNTVYKFNNFVIWSVLLIDLIGIPWMLYKVMESEINFFVFLFASIGATTAAVLICKTVIQIHDEKIESFYLFGKKKFLIFSCRFDEMIRLDYSPFVYMIGRYSGKPRWFSIPTGIKGHQNIIENILKKANSIVISQSAREKILQNKINAENK